MGESPPEGSGNMTNIPNEWIPLLTKPLCEFTPEDYRTYVRGLKIEPPAKKVRAVKLKKHVTWKITEKKKLLSVKVTREPKWITHVEMEKIAEESRRPLEEVMLRARAAGAVIVGTEDEGRELGKF